MKDLIQNFNFNLLQGTCQSAGIATGNMIESDAGVHFYAGSIGDYFNSTGDLQLEPVTETASVSGKWFYNNCGILRHVQ